MTWVASPKVRSRGQSKLLSVVALVAIAGLAFASGRRSAPKPPPPDESAARGAQLVEVGGCDDCHTPKLPDHSLNMSLRMSGFQPDDPLPPPALPGTMTGNAQTTAFRGDWGVSRARNLTPDPETGIGNWTVDQFIQTMRTGIDPSGMKIMPPMPIQALSHASTPDLIAIYNFLRTLNPVVNKVTGA